MPNEETQQQEEQQEQLPAVSPLDPDFLLFAFPVAITIDILYWVVEIGEFANLIIGLPLSLWIESKKGKRPSAQQASKGIGNKALKRWGREFIPFYNNTFAWTRAVISTLSQK